MPDVAETSLEPLSQIAYFGMNNGMQIFWTAIIITILAISKVILHRFWSKGVKKGLIPRHVANIFNVITNVVAIVVFFLMSAVIWRVEAGWLVGGLGLSAGTIVGFASSDTIGNAISGFIILFSRPFKVGNRIAIGEHLGDVEEITLIYTTLRTLNLEKITIPNRKVLSAEVINYGRGSPIRVSIPCSVDYGVNLAQYKQKLLRVASNIQGLSNVLKPYVWMTKLGNNAAEFTLYVFTLNPQGIPQLKADLREKIWKMYKTEKISLTTPNLIQSIPLSTSTGDLRTEDSFLEEMKKMEQAFLTR